MRAVIHFETEVRIEKLLLPRVPVPELDQLPAGADEPHRKTCADVVGQSTNDPVGHAYGGDLVTRAGPVRCLVDGVSDLDSVERHDGRRHRSGGRMMGHVYNNPLPVVFAKMLGVVPNELVGTGSTEGGGDADEDERAETRGVLLRLRAIECKACIRTRRG